MFKNVAGKVSFRFDRHVSDLINTLFILIIKPTRCTALISQIHFWNKILHVSDSRSVDHQEFFTVHTATFRPDPARKLSANLYDIYHCCVSSEKLLMKDRGTV